MKRVHTTEADTRRDDGQAPEALPVGERDAEREWAEIKRIAVSREYSKDEWRCVKALLYIAFKNGLGQLND